MTQPPLPDRSNRTSVAAALGLGSLKSKGADDHRVWPVLYKALEHPDAPGPDALERLRIECTTYATCSSLLFGTSMCVYLAPPEALGDTLLREIFGLVAGGGALLQLITVLLSTVIIIHTTQCTVPANTAAFMGLADSLTYPNTASFYIGLLLSILQLCAAGLALYHPAVVLPMCGGGALAFNRIKNEFIEVATTLNGISAQEARRLSAEEEEQGAERGSNGGRERRRSPLKGPQRAQHFPLFSSMHTHHS